MEFLTEKRLEGCHMIYRKEYMEKSIPFIDALFVKILTGVRRCGKSTILAMLQEELLSRGAGQGQIVSYRFDSLQYEEIDTAAKLYQEIKQYIVPDQKTTQKLTSWQRRKRKNSTSKYRKGWSG